MAGIMGIRRISKALLKPIVIILVVALGIGLFFVGWPRYRSGDDGYAWYKGPSAKVNGVKIKDQEFNSILLQLTQRYGSFYSEEQLREETLKYLVDQELITQALKKEKIKVTKAETQEFLDQLKKIYPTEEEMDGLIRQTGAGNMKGLMKLIEEQLARQKLFTKLAERAEISLAEDEVKERYEMFELAHILVATSEMVVAEPLSDAKALEKAKEIHRKVEKGEDFTVLAKEYSDDQGNKDNGGWLGRGTVFNFRGSFVKEFMEAALALEIGEVSAPVKTQYGYHLIKMVDKKLAVGAEWEKEKEKIGQEILTERFLNEGEFEKWLKKQEEEAELVILDPALRAFRLRLEKKWSEAAEAYEKAIKDKRYKNDLRIYLSASDVYQEAEDYEQALGVLARAPEETQESLEVYLAKAEIYRADDREEEVKEALASAELKAGENLGELERVLGYFKEYEMTEEADSLEEKMDRIMERREQEQEELERLLQEEKEKIEGIKGADDLEGEEEGE